MERKITIKVGNIQLEAELNASKTAEAIWESLPLNAKGNTWGDEVYFSIPVEQELENGQETVDLGDLGYWPVGKAFCIFYGPTPMSHGDEIRPASAVNVFGRISGDVSVLKGTKSGTNVTVEKKN